MRRVARNGATALIVLGVASATAIGCNAILGADDYRVGQANDGGGAGPGDTGGTGNDDTGGAGNDTGAGGRGSGGKGAGGSNPGAGGRGTGGVTPPGTGGVSSGVNAFIGSWTTDAETTSVDCGDGMPTTDMGPDQIDWANGPTAGTIQTFVPVANCTVVANVSGKVATLPRTNCMDDMGITYAISGTFAIQSDGTARLLETVIIGMSGFSCTVDASGVFTMQ